MGSTQRNVNLSQKTAEKLAFSQHFFETRTCHVEGPSGSYFKNFGGGKKNKKNKKKKK